MQQILDAEEDIYGKILDFMLQTLGISGEAFNKSLQKYSFDKINADTLRASLAEQQKTMKKQQQQKIKVDTEEIPKEKAIQILREVSKIKKEALSKVSDPFKGNKNKEELVLELQAEQYKLHDLVFTKYAIDYEVFEKTCDHY